MQLLSTLILIVTLFILHSCYQIKTTVEYLPYSYSEVNKAEEKMIQKIGIEKVITPDSIYTYVSGKTLYAYKYILQGKGIDSTKVTMMTLSPSEKAADNLNISFRSFLIQELDKDHTSKYPQNFYKLNPKSRNEYNKRNWIFMAYGIDYLDQGNPFADKLDNNFAKIFFGLWEVGHYALIFGGPFFGKSEKDKVMIPIIGLSSLVAWKFMLPWLEGYRHVESYNGFANSGYLIPIDVK